MLSNFKRNSVFDIVRGFAVVSMVMANAAPLFAGEFPLFLKVLFSLAAPIFVTMSGLMVAQVIDRHRYSYFFVKGLFIFGVAIIVDVSINKIKPLEGFDVLYLIGFSLPIVAYIGRYSKRVIFSSIIAILLIGVFLRKFLGFNELLLVTDIDFSTHDYLPHIIPWQHWFVDGWFPVFPWTGYMLAGVLVGKLYKESKDPLFFSSSRILLINFSIFITGIALLLVHPLQIYVRHGYHEIFYPATVGLSFVLVGFSLITLAYAEYVKKSELIHNTLASLGRGVLGIYILHLFIINYAIKPHKEEIDSLTKYLLVYLCHIAFIIFVTYCLSKLKAKYTKLPTVIYWVIGK